MIKKCLLGMMLSVVLSACYVYLMNNGAYTSNVFVRLIFCMVIPGVYAGLKDDKK